MSTSAASQGVVFGSPTHGSGKKRGEFLDRPAIQNAPELLEDPTVTHISVGLFLGPYRIESKLGEGGMGEVFRAIDTRLERAVAVKTTQERFSDRFKGEARAISSLNHPNICTLYDVGPNYFVMELVEGETIAARPKGGPFPVKTALSYALQIVAALKEAHGKGIIHRDLKPANIMIAKSGIKVLDFGLAKSGQDETLTASRMVMGTPAYMAPEQREGKPAEARSDIYSFGCVLHEMLTRVRPASQRKRMPSRKLEKIVSTCLEEDPERRWQSAAALERELTRVTAASPSLLRYAGVLLPILLAAAGLAWYYRSPKSPVTVPSEFVQLTNFSDYATAPTLSRDGRMVAFFRGGGFFQGTGQTRVASRPVAPAGRLRWMRWVQKTLAMPQRQDLAPGPARDRCMETRRIALMAGEIASLLLSRMTVPVLFYLFNKSSYDRRSPRQSRGHRRASARLPDWEVCTELASSSPASIRSAVPTPSSNQR